MMLPLRHAKAEVAAMGAGPESQDEAPRSKSEEEAPPVPAAAD
jgi:hypothetical protein